MSRKLEPQDPNDLRREEARRRGAHVSGRATIGEGSEVWAFASLHDDVCIGARCTVGQYVHIGPRVTIGNGCKIQNGAQLFEGVTLEDDVFVGPHAVFTNVTTPRAFISRKAEFKPTLVKRGASIGANVTIPCGITIGEYAMIGAGAVVTKNVLPHSLVVGTPAKQIALVCRCGQRFRGLAHAPPETEVVASCTSCSRPTRFKFNPFYPYGLDNVEQLDGP